jgi:RNA-directed DNA polymerase
MTAKAGASLDTSILWEVIDWFAVEASVRRLQMRIVKAVQEKRWNKVKALQRLLTHSVSGKLSAVHRVTENDGKRTPGVDGDIWNTSSKKLQGVLSLRQRGYRPRPLRRIYIPQGQWKATSARYPDNSGSGHAGAVSAGARSACRDSG